jgi:nucleotide-binding universal stress UspA family protein
MAVIEKRVAVSVKKILLAIDFSLASEKAGSYAKALACRFSSTVELAHVFDPSLVTSSGEARINLSNNKGGLRTGIENLERLRDDFSSCGIETRVLSTEGDRPALELLRIAKEQGVDLIVAGTHWKRGLDRLPLGSTAEELIRNAVCPVFTVGSNVKPIGNGPLVFQSVVYATDLTPEAAKSAVYALSFAQDSDTHPYCCYVLGAKVLDSTRRRVVGEAFQSALKKMIPKSSYDWRDPESVVQHGDAAKAILMLAERVNADLIVLGAGEASFWLRNMERGLTPQLLARAPSPVMTVC